MNTYISSANVEELVADLSALTPGSVITLLNYKPEESTPPVTVVLRLLSSSGYREMQEQSLNILNAYETGDKSMTLDGVSAELLSQAAAALKVSHEASIAAAKVTSGETSIRRGPDYQLVAGSVYRLGEAFYLLRCEVVSGLPPGKVPKSDIPRAKALLSRDLSLPVVRYMHALKLAPEYFEQVKIEHVA